VIEGDAFVVSPAREQSAPQAITRCPTGVTAFVGRTLKGPINTPVPIATFAEFQQCFGGLWQPSTLSYALEQYFENGGRRALVVRVANGARPPTLALPAGADALLLSGVNPGSREYLRASVDYDGLEDDETDRFNLVVQRVRMPGSELIEDQEIFRRVCIEEGSARCVAEVLLHSRLVRALGSLPVTRPERTASGPGGAAIGYVSSNHDGDDGAPLSDYDVIGSVNEGTGLNALRSAAAFDLLCIPPLSRESDLGLSTLLVAARLCRERLAMLIVDPPADWSSPESALAGLRSWPFRSENAAMFFPRVIGFDRLRSRPESFGSSAAAAGMLARGDATSPVWAPAEAEETILRPGLRPAVPVSEAERSRLAHAGINTLQAVRSSSRLRPPACTLAGGAAGSPDWKYLAARRFALFVLASIERGTRWLESAANIPATWAQAQSQVERFLDELDREGAFAGGRPQDSYFVICDERVNRRESIAEGKFNLLFGFALTRAADFHAWLITRQQGRTGIRSIAVNRLATSQQLVEGEIEASIARGFDAAAIHAPRAP